MDCAGCGKTFAPRFAHQRYCPAEPGQSKSPCKRRADNRAYAAARSEVAMCKGCGASFERTQPRPGWRTKRYCSLECQYAARSTEGERPATRKQRLKRQRRRDRAARKLAAAAVGVRGRRVWIAGPCIECGEAFVGVGADARYHDERCAKRRARREYAVRHPDLVREAKRRAEQLRGQRMAWRDQIPARVVAERDGCMCAICGSAVDSGP